MRSGRRPRGVTHKVAYHRLARSDLFNIYDYIAGQRDPGVADGYFGRIGSHCGNLADMPHRGTDRSDLGPVHWHRVLRTTRADRLSSHARTSRDSSRALCRPRLRRRRYSGRLISRRQTRPRKHLKRARAMRQSLRSVSRNAVLFFRAHLAERPRVAVGQKAGIVTEAGRSTRRKKRGRRRCGPRMFRHDRWAMPARVRR